MPYYDNVAKTAQQAHQQSLSVASIISSIAQVFIRHTVEDSPKGQRLMKEADAELKKANIDLDEAMKRVKSAQGKVAEATLAISEKDAELAAMAGHIAETVLQADEHSGYLETVALNARTLADNAKKVLVYDEEFIGWLLNGADEAKLKKVLAGGLSEDRLAFIKAVLQDA